MGVHVSRCRHDTETATKGQNNHSIFAEYVLHRTVYLASYFPEMETKYEIENDHNSSCGFPSPLYSTCKGLFIHAKNSTLMKKKLIHE